MFSAGQLILLAIVTELFVWDLLKCGLATIRHCSTSRAWRKAVEKGINVNFPEEIGLKEVKKDE